MVTEEKPIWENHAEGPGGSWDAAGAATKGLAEGKTPAQGEFTAPGQKKGKRAPVRRSRRRGKNRLATDAAREIRFTFSRFLSILVLSALAVAFLAGLRTTAPDMEYTADNYYDRTHMMDGYVLSTLGLTQEDLDALAQAGGVTAVEGGKSLDATAQDAIVSVRSMPERLNLLEVVQGRLPQAPDECVTESLLMLELGLELGDTLELTLDGDNEGSLTRTAYTVVGVVNSPLYVGSDRGSSSLGGGSVDAFVYIPGENFDLDYYTEGYFTLEGLTGLDSYSQDYEDQLEDGLDGLESLADERAQLRYDTLTADARQEIAAGQQELAGARQELAGAQRELEDARAELDDGWGSYYDGVDTLNREIADARQTLDQALAELEDGEAELADGQTRYEDGLAQYQQGLADYEENLALLDGQQEALDEGYAQYEAALSPYVGTPYYDAMVEQLAPQKAQLDAAQVQLDGAFAQLEAGKAELDESKAVLDETARQLASARQGLDDGWVEYHNGLATLRQEEAEGRQELADALQELEDGEAEYAGGLAEFEDGKAEAEAEIADAEAQLADAQEALDAMDGCQWYVLGRNTNSGFVGYAQDAERVGNLANVFPVIFFLVAALACLTTMTRMVEDQRTEIGALKAMGFSRFAISKKYIGYAFWASFAGGLIGLAVGCTLIPAVIANAFQIMYNVPSLEFKFQPAVCVIAVLAAVVCTTGAALWACLSTLIDTPANLMRPKTPKAGKRVFLEYIKPLWKRLSFTWKVTMRNLFRYQRRFWMTVIGIGGCTALIVTGFGLHESIFDILDKQFDEISLYDATVSLSENAGGEALGEMTGYLDDAQAVDRYLLCHESAVDISAGGVAKSGYLFAVADSERFGQFIHLRHRLDSDPVTLGDDGVIITEKLSEMLEAAVGDTITLEHDDQRVEATVTNIVENYVYHYVYMTNTCYQQLFGQAPEENTVLVAYGDGAGQIQSDQVSTDLMAMDGVASYSYIATIRDSFTDSMNAINYAVIIIILAAAALAFVVLYNLTNINITERLRELATLKVLGFYDREITAYVYRENVFLTLFGIVLGLVLGRFLHAWMVVTVEVDLVMFGRTAPPYAYALAAALTVVFSVVVNIAAHFRLKKVDMVESLKTVE
ncbi:MAG TPA: FtsX-like permease family protein [Candidatus Enterenecus stercoripullorum]|nr:FtsX-like permease family protein [Candidatus Enterenecus stercoripullorum]